MVSNQRQRIKKTPSRHLSFEDKTFAQAGALLYLSLGRFVSLLGLLSSIFFSEELNAGEENRPMKYSFRKRSKQTKYAKQLRFFSYL